MEFSWVTFLLEAINFLVLVWLLKKLFYAPVKRMIAKRQAAIEQTLQDAKAARSEAYELKVRYDGRLRDWETEKLKKREELAAEVSAERERRLHELEALLAEERHKAQAQEASDNARRRIAEQEEALELALRFTSRLLREVACAELEEKIVELAMRQIDSLYPESGSLNGGAAGRAVHARIRSAYSLGEKQRAALERTIRSTAGETASVDFAVDPELIAGVDISMDDMEIRANLRDELEGFASKGMHERL